MALPIALVGPRAAGKTCVGRALAARAGTGFLDLDEEVAALAAQLHGDPSPGGPERRAGAWLRLVGEPTFRALEARALAERALPRLSGGDVLACGGGVVLEEANRELLRARTRVVYLCVPPSVLERRLAADPCPRPPLTGAVDAASEARTVLAAREALYIEAADFIVEASTADIESIAARIARLCPVHLPRASERGPDHD